MAVASLLVLLALGILHTMATFVSKNPLSSLGCKLCITYGEWLSAPPCAPPESWEPISPSLSPRGEQSGWCSEEGPPRSLVLPAAPAGCSVSECASLSLWKPLLHRTHTTVVMTKECGFAHPQVLPMALSTCGSSLMPCFLASWSSPLALWCFCTDTARGCSMFTPVLGTTDAPRDQSHPHHPDAGGHLCHRLHTEFHFFFLYRFLLKYSSMFDTDRSYFGFMFPHF